MDDGVDRVLREDGVDGGLVHEVRVVEDGGLAAELGDTAQRFLAGVHQVVDDHHVMAGFLQGQDSVRTDVTGAASNQDFHVPYAIPNGRVAFLVTGRTIVPP